MGTSLMTCSIEQFRYISVLHLQRRGLLMDPLIHFRNKDVLYFPGGCRGESHLRRMIFNLQTEFFPLLKSMLHMTRVSRRNLYGNLIILVTTRREEKRTIRKSWWYLDIHMSWSFEYDVLFTTHIALCIIMQFLTGF